MQYVKHHKRIAALCVLFVCAVFSLALTNYPNGVASYGIPLPAGDYMTTGKYLFVNNTSNYSQDSYPTYGTSMEKPLRTIDYALSKCDATKGDIVFVAPYHNETLSIEGGISRFRWGSRLVGLGQGDARPLITYNRARASIIVTVPEVSIENMRFTLAGVSLVSTGAYLDDGKQVRIGVSVASGATQFTFRGNEFKAGNGVSRFGTPLYLSGGTRSVIRDNVFTCNIDTSNGVTAFVGLEARVDNVYVIGNIFDGKVYNLDPTFQSGGMIAQVSGTVTSGGFTAGVSSLVLSDNTMYCATAKASPFWFPMAAGVTVSGMSSNNRSYSSLSGGTVINQSVQGYARQP